MSHRPQTSLPSHSLSAALSGGDEIGSVPRFLDQSTPIGWRLLCGLLGASCGISDISSARGGRGWHLATTTTAPASEV